MRARAPAALAGVAALAALGACAGPQSALDPRGPAAATLADFSWILFAGGALIFLGTMALLGFGLLRPDRTKGVPPLRFILWGGLVFPGVTLLILTVGTAMVGNAIDFRRLEDPLRVTVIGNMFWWEVVYPDLPGGRLVTANEMRIPVGRPVEVTVTSRDVIHSFWVPALHGKMDLIPGRMNRITLIASEAGVVRGQCAEFCGDQHAWMALFVVALEPADFDAWVREQQAVPAPPDPADTQLARGRAAFLEAGCGACHVIRGLAEGPYAAVGQLGPDLTHVGSRLSIGAGVLPNGVGPLAAWIAGVQDIKAGARMPSYHTLDGETLTALAAYLESLK